MRSSYSEYDMIDDLTYTKVRTADGRVTNIPTACSVRLNEFSESQERFSRAYQQHAASGSGGGLSNNGSFAGTGTALTSSFAFVSSWLSPSSASLGSASSPHLQHRSAGASSAPNGAPEAVFDAGCSNREAAEFVAGYFETKSVEMLTTSPRLLLDALELAFCIRFDELFIRGCGLLGSQIREVLGSRVQELLVSTTEDVESASAKFAAIVQAVRGQFHLPPDSPAENSLLYTEVARGRNGRNPMTVTSYESRDATADISKFENNLKLLDPFQKQIWQPDAEVSHCPDCKTSLNAYFNYKMPNTVSHCRVCGKVKCTRCVRYTVDRAVAKVEKPGAPETSLLRKACHSCFLQATEARRYAFLSNAFMQSGLGVVEVSILRFVCPGWRVAAELCLREYHNMLYHSHSLRVHFTTGLRRLVVSSAPSYRGHAQAALLLLQAIQWEPNPAALDDSRRREQEGLIDVICDTFGNYIPAKDTPLPQASPDSFVPISHMHLLCTRACMVMQGDICGLQMLEGLRGTSRRDAGADRLKELACGLVLTSPPASPQEAAAVPLLVDMLGDEGVRPAAFHTLVELSSRSKRAALRVFVELQARPNSDRDTIQQLEQHLRRVSSLDLAGLMRTLAFLRVLDAMDVSSLRAVVESFRSHGHKCGVVPDTSMSLPDAPSGEPHNGVFPLEKFIYPFDASVHIVGIRLAEISIKISNARPVVLPLVDSAGAVRYVLYKRECLRRDYVAVTIMGLMQTIAQQEGTLSSGGSSSRRQRLAIPCYDVLPSSPRSGLIEMVNNCRSLQRIRDDFSAQLRASSAGGAHPSSSGAAAPSSVRSEPHMPTTRGIPSAAPSSGQSQTPPPAPMTRARSGSLISPEHNPLLAYLLQLCVDHNISERDMARRFLASAKFFLVMNYLLAIGDRHRDNVMITDEGYIFHIDFGFIMGTQPTAEALTVKHQSFVRFDEDLNKCIQYFIPRSSSTKQSLTPEKATSDFLDATSEMFLSLRPHVYIPQLLLVHLVTHRELPQIPDAEALSETMCKLTMSGSERESVKQEFKRQLRDSMGAQAFRDRIYTTARTIRSWLM